MIGQDDVFAGGGKPGIVAPAFQPGSTGAERFRVQSVDEDR